jgi:MFS family permease
MMVGQILFGNLGDTLGRKHALTVTLLVCASGAIGSAAFVFATVNGPSISAQLACWRFLLGIGAGGVYPLSAVIAKESVLLRRQSTPDDYTESTAVAIVFSMQGFGYLGSPLLMTLLVALPISTAARWRLQLGLGAVPVLIAAASTLRSKHTHKSVTVQADSNVDRICNGDNVISERKSFCTLLLDHKKLLIGTAGVWFLFDIEYYVSDKSIILFRTLVSAIVFTALMLALRSLSHVHVGQYTIHARGKSTAIYNQPCVQRYMLAAPRNRLHILLSCTQTQRFDLNLKLITDSAHTERC